MRCVFFGIVNIDEVVTAFRNEGRTLAWPGETLEALPRVTRRSRAGGQEMEVTAYDLSVESADAAIAQEIAHFGGGRSFEWKAFSFDEPRNLVERLGAAGFSVGRPEAVVVYDLNQGLEPLLGEFDCEVKRVDSVERLNEFRSAAEAIFEKDYSPTTGELAEALRTGQQGHEAYVAYADGTPAAVGRLYTNSQSAFAGLYGGGTKREFRSRGIYRALVAARAQDAHTRGARYLQVDALPTSRPILERLGFIQIATTWPCTFLPAS